MRFLFQGWSSGSIFFLPVFILTLRLQWLFFASESSSELPQAFTIRVGKGCFVPSILAPKAQHANSNQLPTGWRQQRGSSYRVLATDSWPTTVCPNIVTFQFSLKKTSGPTYRTTLTFCVQCQINHTAVLATGCKSSVRFFLLPEAREALISCILAVSELYSEAFVVQAHY